MRGLFQFPGHVVRIAFRPVAAAVRGATRTLAAAVRGTRRLLGSFRFWILALLGVLILLVIYYAMADYFTPLTVDAYLQAYVVQVAPQVEGQVVSVPVHEGQVVRKGDLLFALDRRPFEHKVRILEARRVLAVQQVEQLKAELAASRAEHRRLVAESAYADVVNRQEQQIFRTQATTERRYQEALRKSEASRASVEKATGEVDRVRAALDARVGSEHAAVAEVEAQSAEARLNLDYTRVYAPCDGVITDLQLREGDYIHVGEAVLSVIDTSRWLVVAQYREDCLVRMREGQPALVALQGAPGRLLPAHVRRIGWGVGQGQGVPSGRLPRVETLPSWVPPSQRFQVRLELDHPEQVPLRVGMTGSVSVYTRPVGTLNRITRTLHQVIAWFYYL
jgi:multidrug efflux system membrane fusion protein